MKKIAEMIYEGFLMYRNKTNDLNNIKPDENTRNLIRSFSRQQFEMFDEFERYMEDKEHKEIIEVIDYILNLLEPAEN